MNYQAPEVLEIGNAGEVIQILFTDVPSDFEPSTQRFMYIDPQ